MTENLMTSEEFDSSIKNNSDLNGSHTSTNKQTSAVHHAQFKARKNTSKNNSTTEMNEPIVPSQPLDKDEVRMFILVE